MTEFQTVLKIVEGLNGGLAGPEREEGGCGGVVLCQARGPTGERSKKDVTAGTLQAPTNSRDNIPTGNKQGMSYSSI